jgi:hypothetical protein
MLSKIRFFYLYFAKFFVANLNGPILRYGGFFCWLYVCPCLLVIVQPERNRVFYTVLVLLCIISNMPGHFYFVFSFSVLRVDSYRCIVYPDFTGPISGTGLTGSKLENGQWQQQLNL